MGSRGALKVTLVALGATVLAHGSNVASTGTNPITRVVELLQGLAKKVESDGKAEEDMFESYQCWYKTVISTKKKTNSEAADRIKNLESYIADIDGGKIEFTNEREDLEKEAASLEAEIAKSTEIRNTEERDFLAAKDEMEAAIESLEEAVQVLQDGTKESMLLSWSKELHTAVQVGQSFLKKEDMALLSKALQPEHNQKYKTASTKIQEILVDMLEAFKDNLADAIKMEAEKKKTFETLMSSKNAQLSAAQNALADADQETGARTLNKDEANAEKTNLEEQVSRDEEYITQAEASYATILSEWNERKRLRTAEVASIMEAAAVLSNDDARDLAKKSFSSQGAFLLQERAFGACQSKRAAKAKEVLKRTADKSQDLRVSMLAVQLMHKSLLKGKFDKVVGSIDEMISNLHAENDADLKTKEDCENDRNENTAVARRTSYVVDEQTAVIVRKKHQQDELNSKIAAAQDAIKDAQLKLEEATVNRQKEKAEYKASKADDEAAKAMVEKARGVLQKFYEDNGLTGFVQKRAEMPDLVAGEAPPPPPSMWSEPYGGAKGESNGIQTILEMIVDDIEKDIRDATAAENTSQKDFEAFKSDTELAVEDFEKQITGFEEEISECEKDIESARTLRADKRETMDGALQVLRSIAEGCDFMAANFEYRKQMREEEVDGLLEAEASLQGGSLKSSSASALVEEGSC
jgi:hypothetical protein